MADSSGTTDATARLKHLGYGSCRPEDPTGYNPALISGDNPLRSFVVVPALVAGLASSLPVSAQTGQTPTVTITINAPNPEQFDVALDEVELRWPERARPTLAVATRPVPRATVKSTEADRTLLNVATTHSLEQMRSVLQELQTIVPSAVAHLVLYESGKQRSPGSRCLLGREVGVIVDPNADAKRILANAGARNVRALDAVPGGYVVLASDPVATLELATALMASPGVRSAYPLILRQISHR